MRLEGLERPPQLMRLPEICHSNLAPVNMTAVLREKLLGMAQYVSTQHWLQIAIARGHR